eukprot:scaffold4063_cov40-Attheya_sp.AAC.3
MDAQMKSQQVNEHRLQSKSKALRRNASCCDQRREAGGGSHFLFSRQIALFSSREDMRVIVKLEKITLDDLYQDKKIVGNILDPDYKPVMMLGFKDRASRYANSLTKSDTREVVV